MVMPTGRLDLVDTTQLDRLAYDVTTYMTLSTDRKEPVSAEELNVLKIEISELVATMPAPQEGADEGVRTIYALALDIITQDNIKEPVKFTRRAVNVLNQTGEVIASAPKIVKGNTKDLLYFGAALTMLYFGGIPGLVLVGTLYAWDKTNANREHLGRTQLLEQNTRRPDDQGDRRDDKATRLVD